MRVRGRSEFFLPSYTRCARSISMSRPPREGIHLERLTLRKPAALEPSAPSGNPNSRTLFLLLLSSISVIFSVSRSSWFLKSVTVLLSSRAATWTESTRSRVCFAVVAITSSSTLSSSTELLVTCMSSRSSRNAGSLLTRRLQIPPPPTFRQIGSLLRFCFCLLIGRNWNVKHPPSGQFNAGRTNRTLYYRTVLITWTGTCSGQRLMTT